MSAIDELLSISTESLVDPALVKARSALLPPHCSGLAALLTRRNGFYAFEGALHVFALGGPPGLPDCLEWNEPGLWKGGYGSRAKGLFFFSEDAFGRQFGFRKKQIIRFEPETTNLTKLGPDLETWAKAILEDHRWLTGWPLAHEWQMKNGTLLAGMRLVPALPFVVGGQYSIDNLVADEAANGMRFRCDFYQQTKHLPNGTRLNLEIRRD